MKMIRARFIAVVLLLLTLAISFSSGAFADENPIEINLYKKEFNSSENATLADMQKAVGIDGMTFSIYDVTTFVNQLSSKGKLVKEIQEIMSKTTKQELEQQGSLSVGTGKTITNENGESGFLRFLLPPIQEGTTASYLIIEESQTSYVSVNTLLNLTSTNNGKVLKIYPKSINKTTTTTETEVKPTVSKPSIGKVQKEQQTLPQTNSIDNTKLAFVGIVVLIFLGILTILYRKTEKK